MNDWQHEQNKKQLKEFSDVGYRWEIDGYGYQVWYGDEYITGAGTARNRKMHWKHAQENIKDYTNSVLIICQRHSKALQGGE